MNVEEEREKEINDIWYALDYQDRRINKLTEENQEYKERLKYSERRLNIEIKDINKQIIGIKTNMESIIDIVKVSKIFNTEGISVLINVDG